MRRPFPPSGPQWRKIIPFAAQTDGQRPEGAEKMFEFQRRRGWTIRKAFVICIVLVLMVVCVALGSDDVDGEVKVEKEKNVVGQSTERTNVLRVSYYHKTDGIGGHVRTNMHVFAAARYFNLTLVCDHSALFNGHMASTEPNWGNRYVLGCDESSNALGEWTKTISKKHVERAVKKKRLGLVKTNWSSLSKDVTRRGLTSSPSVFDIGAMPCDMEKSMVPVGKRDQHEHLFWPLASAFLREGYWAHGDPERIAAPLWSSIGGSGGITEKKGNDRACFRVAVHWRTATWSLHGFGVKTSAADLFRKILLERLLVKGEGASCVRIALIAQMKEDAKAQREVLELIESVKASVRSLDTGRDVAIATFVSDSSKSIVKPDASLGADDADAIERDLALMTTSHMLFVGRSQFTFMAAGLQRTDGVHIVADERNFASSYGRVKKCRVLSNTVLPADARARAAKRTVGGDSIAAFLVGASKTPVCSEARRSPDPRAIESAFTNFGRCRFVKGMKEKRGRRRQGPAKKDHGLPPRQRRKGEL